MLYCLSGIWNQSPRTMKHLQDRTKQFAIDVFRFSEKLPDTHEFRVIRNQLTKSASSVGANYRSACRAQSKRLLKKSYAKAGGDTRAKPD